MSDIRFSAKQYLDGSISFETVAANTNIDAESLEDCTKKEKEAIAEWIRENYWAYLDDAVENENELLSVQGDDETLYSSW